MAKRNIGKNQIRRNTFFVKTVLSFAMFHSPLAQAVVPTSSWSLGLEIEDSQNFYEETDYSKTHVTSFSFTPKYTTTNWSYSSLISISHENNLQENTVLENTVFSISHKSISNIFSSQWSSGYGLVLVLPTDEEMRKSSHYFGSVKVTGSLSRGFSLFGLGTKFTYAGTVGKNFHEYELDADSQPLVEYSIKNQGSFDFELTDKLGLSVSFDYTNGLTYQNFPREKFSSNIDLGYDFSSGWNAYLGVNTDGDARRANGVDSNISFYNENISEVHVGLGLTL